MRHRFRPFRVAIAVGLIAAGTLVPAVPAHATAAVYTGYDLVGSDGGVFAFSPASFMGSLGDRRIPGRIVAALDGVVDVTRSPSPSFGTSPGYLLISDEGVAYPFGLQTSGDLRGVRLNAPIVAAAAVPDGYFLVAADGGVFTFGRAQFAGSLAARRLPDPIVGIALTLSRHGYWLVDSAGRVYPFGDAPDLGDADLGEGVAPVVGIVESVDIPVDVNAPRPEGYLLATADGHVIPFGAARSHGDASLLHLSAPIAGITSPSSGGGYFLFAQDGGVFTFGTFFRGSLGDRHLNGPIVAMTIRNYSACKGTQC